MTKVRNTIKLHIPSILGFEKVAMESAAAAANIMGFHPGRIDDLRTAISEACINAIEHGNRFKKNTKVLVTLKIDKKSLEVNVKDEGKGIQKALQEPEINKQINGDQDVSGWGIFLIKRLVDEVEFKKIPKGGNMTRLVIHLDR